MATLESLKLSRVSLDGAATLYKECAEREGNLDVLDKILSGHAEDVPQPTHNNKAPEQVKRLMGMGVTIITVIGPHLTEKDHIDVGASMYRVDLGKLALNTGFLARAENWFDHGEEVKQLMDDALALPTFRSNPVKDALGKPLEPTLPRFDAKVVEESRDMLNQLVVTTADKGRHIGLFGPGTRYSRAADKKGAGPYKDIPIKDGVEFFGRAILNGDRGKKMGYAAIFPVGIYAPEDNLSATPNVHFGSPRLFTPNTPKRGIIELASTGVTHAVAMARHAAQVSAHN